MSNSIGPIPNVFGGISNAISSSSPNILATFKKQLDGMTFTQLPSDVMNKILVSSSWGDYSLETQQEKEKDQLKVFSESNDWIVQLNGQ